MRILWWSIVCAAFACSNKPSEADTKAREREAHLAAAKLNFEAFPMWAAAHPDKACPDKIDDLLAQVELKSVQDPWGHPYRMLCGANVPPGVRGLGIVSDGADGKPDTADDVKSWEK